MSTDTPNDKTPHEAAVALAVEKITAAMAQGDQVSGMILGRDIVEMKAIFNAAARQLDLPVLPLGPLPGEGTKADVQKDLGAHMLAFRQAAAAPAMLLYDASDNQKLKDPVRQSAAISNFIGSLTVQFPKAIYIQLIADKRYDPSPKVYMYCMNPKVPRDPKDPIRPV